MQGGWIFIQPNECEIWKVKIKKKNWKRKVYTGRSMVLLYMVNYVPIEHYASFFQGLKSLWRIYIDKLLHWRGFAWFWMKKWIRLIKGSSLFLKKLGQGMYNMYWNFFTVVLYTGIYSDVCRKDGVQRMLWWQYLDTVGELLVKIFVRSSFTHTGMHTHTQIYLESTNAFPISQTILRIGFRTMHV